MSHMIPENLVNNGDIFGMMIDDGCVFNLQTLQGGLGLKSVQSTKEWCYKHGIRPVINGRTWVFTGRTFRLDLEAMREAQDAARAARADAEPGEGRELDRPTSKASTRRAISSSRRR